ncbi:MAG: citramalate synthase [Firmicutes bacterium]|nr:citramalate synthase [Bacillota bacterium]
MNNNRPQIFIYDTTLRDGSQGEGISLSISDKLKIAARLDLLGVHYVEGGWPASNPKDLEFFKEMARKPLSRAKLTAFTSTCRPGGRASDDFNLAAVVETGVKAAAVVGKSWDFQVTEALETSLEENLRMVGDSIAWLKQQGIEVIFDAEHFFDGYRANPGYALDVLKAASTAGAGWLALCDTNGGTLPWQIEEVIGVVRATVNTPLAIHAHNDGGLAVVNTLAAVRAGVTQVQGTLNGYGERCGNANLCTVIPNLELKMGYPCLGKKNLAHLTEVSHFVSEVANMPHYNQQPFVGNAAFAHKGGIHVSAVLKNPETYEHISPESVGNRRRVLVSELSGVSNLKHKAQEFGLDLSEFTDEGRQAIEHIKRLEHEGYQFEGADASLELVLLKALGRYREFFCLENLKVLVDKKGSEPFNSEATVKINVKVTNETVHTAAEGDGPVNAMDNALRKALGEIYPCIRDFHLTDYKVRVVDETEGTAATVRVLIETSDQTDSWSTVGVSENIIEASFKALMDSFNYALLKRSGDGRKRLN